MRLEALHWCYMHLPFCFSYSYVRQTKLASSLVNFWAHENIMLACLLDWLIDWLIADSEARRDDNVDSDQNANSSTPTTLRGGSDRQQRDEWIDMARIIIINRNFSEQFYNEMYAVYWYVQL